MKIEDELLVNGHQVTYVVEVPFVAVVTVETADSKSGVLERSEEEIDICDSVVKCEEVVETELKNSDVVELDNLEPWERGEAVDCTLEKRFDDWFVLLSEAEVPAEETAEVAENWLELTGTSVSGHHVV